MMSLFSRGASPPPNPSSAPQPTQPAQPSQPTQPTQPAPPMTSNGSSNNAEPASHVIHSPLPSRPSPVQPASTIDELLKGFHSNSPAPPTEQSHSSPPLAPAPAPAPPAPPVVQPQPSQNTDLLALLSSANPSGSPVSSSSQPISKPNPAQEQNNAGRMLLDSLLSSAAPKPVDPPNFPQPQPEPHQPRKGPFDFVSPMDAFAPPPSTNVPPPNSSNNTNAKRSIPDPSEGKLSPAMVPLTTSPDTHNDSLHGDSMPGGSQDGGDGADRSRRKSIDLLEQLTRAVPLSHAPIASDAQNMPTNPPPTLNYGPQEPLQSQQQQGPPPLSNHRPPVRQPSPLPPSQQIRDQSPALMGQTPPSTSPGVPGFAGPILMQNSQARASPTFKGRLPGNGAQKKDWKKGGATRSPAGPQSFTLDLSLPLAATSATSDSLHITPIALLKLESIYVPGCTIGVSHWIAYAMTKGRVRLIARANGARALLKLPQAFSANSSIVDLVTSGNRLAGVTSDGGFVVWEVPPMVDDDIPSLLLVSVPPSPSNPYKSIKWHPTDPDVLAIATNTEIHLINVSRLFHIHNGDSIGQGTLIADAEIFSASPNSVNPSLLSPNQQIAAFAFDPSHNALATISQDGQLNLWAIGSQQPPSYQAEPSYGQQQYLQSHQLLWAGKIPGEGAPSSLFFMDQAQGVIIGRKRNTIIQLVSPKSTNVQASTKFIYGNGVFGGASTSNVAENNDFFAHLSYDPRIRCIWAASSHRASIMALRIASPDSPPSAKSSVDAPLLFEQILDFPILHPTISLGILLSSEGNEVEEMERGSSGMEVAGAVPSGPNGEISMALVAYVIHAGGVDQVLIGKQDLEAASQSALSKLPVQAPPSLPSNQPPQQQQQPQQQRQESPSNMLVSTRNNHPTGPRELLKGTPPNVNPPPVSYNEPPSSFGPPSAPMPAPPLANRNFGPMDTNSPQRSRSPPSELEGDGAEGLVDVRGTEGGGKRGNNSRRMGKKGAQGQTVIPPGASSGAESSVSGMASDATVGILKEIQKVEDGISSKITAVVGREFRDQQRRLEQMHEQERFNASEFQDRLVKNLSGELVKSTGRVFEAALKTEVQRTILPALEIITKTEVRQVLDGQIVRGISESMNQTLPNEIERLLLRPDVSNHVARTFSSAVTSIIERHVKDSISRVLIPSYQEATTEMYDQLYKEISEEILNLRKEIVTWQSEALKGQESLLRDMELSIRSLTEQVKTLSAQRSNTPYHAQSHRSSPAPLPVHIRGQQSQVYPAMDKMANISSWQQISAATKPDMPVQSTHQNMPQHQSSMPMPMPNQAQYGAPPQQLGQLSPHSYQTQPPPQQPQFQVDRPEEWEKTFLSALSTPDNRALREVLATCPADKVMPLNGPLLVGQTIVLSVIHKVAGALADIETLDESISLLWWLTRASQVLDAHDRIIHDYLDKMLPNIQENLFRAIPRLSSAGPQYNRQLSDLLQTLVIKAHNPQ